MRNLKKILALVLALVMSLSLVTIANAADFKDSDEIDYEEAVAVMSTIGVINGMDDGNFDPDGILTREQAAKLITYMLMGENAEKLGIESSSFKDVAMTRWSAPAIEYCASLGIIDGAGDGNFYPAGKLTGYAFAKMLLTAIGYDSKIEGFTGASWTINVATLAMEVGLDNGLENGISSAELTRQEAAQMALNAIQTPLVTYDKQASITVNGAEVNIGAAEAKYVTTTLAKEQRISKQTLTNSNEYTVEFGEKYFTGLRLTANTDDFDRPSHTWTYNTDEIGTYVDYDKLVETYTTAITGKNLYELIGSTVIKEYDVYYYVDGAVNDNIKASNMIRTNTVKYNTTGNGVLTQVFVDHDAEDIIITSINTYLAEALADYNEKKGTLSVNVYDAGAGTGKTIDVEEIAGIEDYKDGDFLMVNWAETDKAGNYEIVKIADPDIMTDVTLTKYSTGSYVVAGGEQYDYAQKGKVYNATPLKDYNQTALTNYTYNLFLDQYGYVLGTEVYEGQANYLFLTGYDLNGSNLSIKTATGAAIFLDGTMSEIQINVNDTDKNLGDTNGDGAITGKEKLTDADYALLRQGPDNGASEYNKWFTYTTSQKSGETVYTLKPAEFWAIVDATASADKINSASVRVVDSKTGARAYGNDDSVYMTVGTGSVDLSSSMGITKVTGTYTGVQNVDLKVYDTTDNKLTVDYKTNPGAIFAVYDEDLYIIGAIVVGEDANSTDNYAYVLDDAQNEYVDEDDNYYWDFEAVVDGEIKTLTVKEKYGTFDVSTKIGHYIGAGKNGLMKLTYDVDGYVIDAVSCSDSMANIYGDSDFGKDTDPDLFSAYTVQYDNSFSMKKSADFMVAGRTLYGHTNDAGLTLETGAPVIVVQEEKPNVGSSKLTYTAYSTISQALAALNDSSDFEGWVSAVLNDKGTAEYIVLNSKDAVGFTSDDPNAGGNSGIGDVYGVDAVISVATTGVPANDDALLRAEVKAQADGVYQVDGVVPSDAGSATDETILYFKVTNKEAGSGYTLNIRNSKNQLVYTESYAGPYAAGPVMCYYGVAAGTEGYTNPGIGSGATTDLAAGVYTYTFTCGTNSISGTFTIK